MLGSLLDPTVRRTGHTIHGSPARTGGCSRRAIASKPFPFLSQGRHITLGKFEVFVQVEDDFAGMYIADTLKFALAVGNSASTPAAVQPSDMLSLADLEWRPVR